MFRTLFLAKSCLNILPCVFHYEAKLHWIGAQFCVCMSLDSDSRDKSLNMFPKVREFHLQNFSDSAYKYL